MKMKSKINIVQLIIPAFIVLMIIMLVANQLSVSEYITLSLRRTCMLLVMVLAVTPTIYSGVGIWQAQYLVSAQDLRVFR